MHGLENILSALIFLLEMKYCRLDRRRITRVFIMTYQQWKPKTDGDKENINDDIVFEMELIRQVEIDIACILMLVAKYHDSNCEDKEFLVKKSLSRKKQGS